MTSNQPSESSIQNAQQQIIATTQKKKQGKCLRDVLKGLFSKDPVSAEIDKEGVRAFGDDVYLGNEEGQKCTWPNLFCCEKREQCLQLWKQQCTLCKDIDVKWASQITKFKQENILTLGDIRIRSVLMAFSSAVMYKAISWNTTGLLRKTRNLGISFLFMGYWFVPELFNPFLKKQSLASSI